MSAYASEEKIPKLKIDGYNLVSFKKDFWRRMAQEGRRDVTKNVLHGSLPKTEPTSTQYTYAVIKHRKVIKAKGRIVPPRGHDDREVEPEHWFDGYNGLYQPD